MEVPLFVIIVTVLCQNFIVVKTYERVMFDVTIHVNELIAKKISRDDFRNDVESAFGLIRANVNTSTIFYATDGRSVEEFEKHKQAFCTIMKETFHKLENMLISWTINITEIPKPGAGYSNIQEFYGCNPKLLLNFHDETKCEDMEFNYEFLHLVNYLNISGSFAGVGYDESLIVCQSRIGMYYLHNEPPTVLIRIRFGATNGVTESFGLFQSRMNFLFGKYVRKSNILYYSDIIYYPCPNCVGDDNHQHLLITFATIWTAADKEKGSMLLQVPKSRFDASASTEFTIIPRFYQYTVTVKKPVQWPLFMLTTSFKNHQLIFVNLAIWNDYWNEIHSSTQTMPEMPSPEVDIVLDCTDIECREDSVTFPLNGNRSDLTILMDLKSYNRTWQSSLNENVGCLVKETSFFTLNESYVEHVIRECQRINGRHYILKTQLIIDWSIELDEYSFDFENVIRKELHALNWFRKSILKREPAGKVYFDLDYTETHRPYQEMDLRYMSTLFCQDLKPTVNLYLEAIFNWAKLESFPIILLITDLFSLNPLPSWFSYMRRLNYPYTDWDTDTLKYSLPNHTSPSFLMQNYLKSIHGWTMDTCIDWTEKREEINKDFFHNEILGAVLSSIKNQTLNKEDYSMLLRFLFHRFRLFELFIGSDFQELLLAIDDCLLLEYFDFSTKFYFKYKVTSPFTQIDLPSFQSFLVQLQKTNFYEMQFLKGVHVELDVGVVDSEGQVVINSNRSTLKPVYNLLNYAKVLNFSCGIEISSINACYEMLRQFHFNSVYSGIISTVNYIICKDNIEYSVFSHQKTKLESVLDSHLALKRIMHQLVPKLEVYFRVEFDFDIAKSNTTFDQYSSLLALFKSFGTAYNISYFVVEAFDNQMEEMKTGWWGVKNYSDLTNPQSYIEKITVSRGQTMWYPPPSDATVAVGQNFTVVIIVSSVSSAIVFLLCVFGICLGFRYKKLQRHLTRFLSDSEVQDFINGRDAANSEPETTETNWVGTIEQTRFRQEHKLDLSDLTIDIEKVLGVGAFGTVFKGFARDIPAAIKRPNKDCSKSTFKCFLTEVKILTYIGKHTNVIEFLGAYIAEINKGVLYIATEFCACGSLESFLRKTAKDTRIKSSNQSQNVEMERSVPPFYQLLAFSMGIAEGMEYIESKRVIHGDLATRNVLLDVNMVCKIGDFGLSRKLYNNYKYVKKSQEPFPWRWMAPESLDKMEFTSKSDMWSYGVTLWEIYSLGKIPYAGLNWSVDFSNELQTGLRLPIPEFASENIFDKMAECWNLNSDERPTFTDMIKFFRNLREDAYAILGSPE